MINSSELILRFKDEFNRINVDANISLTIQNMDIALTKSVNLFIYEVARNTHHNKDARLYLTNLEVNNAELKFEEFTNYSIKALYPSDCFRPIKYRYIASKKDLSDEKHLSEITIHPVQRNEIYMLKTDSNWKPDFNYRETIYTDVGKGIEIIVDNKFTSESVYCDYYLKHPDITTPSKTSGKYYLNGDGEKITKDQGLLLDNMNQIDYIVSLGVLFMTINVGDTKTFSMKKDEILSGLNLVKTKFL